MARLMKYFCDPHYALNSLPKHNIYLAQFVHHDHNQNNADEFLRLVLVMKVVYKTDQKLHHNQLGREYLGK